MSSYNAHAGHNYKVPGANGFISETKENRVITQKVIALLKQEGHTVYDCTDENGTTSSKNLANIVAKCNTHEVDLDISIHFNAFNGKANGVEVYIYNDKTKEIAKRICDNISELGYENRGVKYGQDLYVLRKTNSKAILIECLFCDNKGDTDKYDPDKIAKAIVEGVLNKKLKSSPTNNTTEEMYRIRKTWEDAKSQIGAYKNLESAKKECKEGYSVFDGKGKAVYTNKPVEKEEEKVDKLYRVRKSWSDVKSQLGAYSTLDNAIKNCPVEYSVFDWNGKSVHTTKKEEEKVTNTSVLKGMDREAFIEYIGLLAKEDMKTSGILASVTTAQGILESADGQSILSLQANNLFGMKANLSGNNWGSTWDGQTISKVTKEEVNGELIDVTAKFRKYNTVEESIKDHSDYLRGAKNGSKLRYEGIIGERDYKKAIQIIKDGGYATDSKYVDKIVNLIEKYDLDRFDLAVSPSDLSELFEKINANLNDIIDYIEDVQDTLKDAMNK